MKCKEITERSQLYPPVVPVLLIVATILAAFFRFFRLDQIPPGFTFDEASHALDALDILSGQLTLISTRLKQTPTGYMYLLAGAFQLFGTTILVQRALTAVFGLLLIPINFFAVRTLFDEAPGQKPTWIAIFSTLLVSTSFWGVITSRIGYEYILPPVFALLAVFFFWRGYQNERWGLLLAAGFFAAIEFYLYEGSAPFLLIIPTSMILSWLLNKVFPRSSVAKVSIQWKTLLFFSLVVAIVALPLFLALTSGPNPEAERSLRLSILNRATGPIDTSKLLVDSLIAHIRPFLAIDGDVRWFSNLQGRPILDPLLAICFVAGVLISFKRIRQWPYLFLLIYWGGTLSPAILTIAGSPFYFRMINALPPTYIFIALTWTELYCWLKKQLSSLDQERLRSSATWLALVPFFFVSLIWLPFETYRDYFYLWANHPKVAFYHDVSIVSLVERMENETDSESIFILPRNAASPRPNYTLDFLYQGQTPFLYLPVEEATVRQTLSLELSGYRTVHLITNLIGGREQDQRKADPTGLLPLLFEKYGTLLETEKTDYYTIQTYQLDSNNTDFEAHLQMELPPDFEPLSFIIANQVKLAGFKQSLNDNSLVVDLAWQGWSKAVIDYTVFIQLLNEDGQRVAGVDVLPERGFTTLDRKELMITHYTISLTDDFKPGAYKLLVGLYYFAGDELVNVGAVTLDEPVLVE